VVALEAIDRLEDRCLMNDDPAGSTLKDTPGTKRCEFWTGGAETVEGEQPRRRAVTDERSSGACSSDDREALLPCRRVAADDE